MSNMAHQKVKRSSQMLPGLLLKPHHLPALHTAWDIYDGQISFHTHSISINKKKTWCQITENL